MSLQVGACIWDSSNRAHGVWSTTNRQLDKGPTGPLLPLNPLWRCRHFSFSLLAFQRGSGKLAVEEHSGSEDQFQWGPLHMTPRLSGRCSSSPCPESPCLSWGTSQPALSFSKFLNIWKLSWLSPSPNTLSPFIHASEVKNRSRFKSVYSPQSLELFLITDYYLCLVNKLAGVNCQNTCYPIGSPHHTILPPSPDWINQILLNSSLLSPLLADDAWAIVATWQFCCETIKELFKLPGEEIQCEYSCKYLLVLLFAIFYCAIDLMMLFIK